MEMEISLARPKSYTVEDVTEKVVFAFWQHGYQALGVRELEQITGLNQYAIRTEFGGKEGLYLAALEMYCERAVSEAMVPMKEGGVPEIAAFLRSLVRDGSMTSSKFGCLVVNTGIENARINSPQLDAVVTGYWNTLATHFASSLRNAQRKGSIAASVETDIVAGGLVSGVMGIHTRNRIEGRHDAGAELVDLLCSQLEVLEQT